MSDETKGSPPQFDDVLRILPGVVYVFNQHTQSNEYANKSLADLLGYSVAETQAMGDAMLPTLCHPDDLGKVGAHFGAIQQLKDGATLTVQYRVKHKDGHWVWLKSVDSVLERDGNGDVLRHIGSAFDITPQKQSEAEAITAKDELETTFNAATSGIVAFDHDSKIVRANNRALHLLGDVPDAPPFVWPQPVKFLDAESLQPLDASADPVRRALSGHQLRSETHLMCYSEDPSGRRYVRLNTATPETAETGIHTVLVIDDVSTEERNRQVVERKSRLDALGQLTGGIAHDFNNLLASMLYAVELAGKTTDPAKRTRYLKTAANSIEGGRALTTRLLSFARKQPGLASVQNTESVLTEFERLVRPMLEAQIDINLAVDSEELRHYCDHNQLETALMNLVLNARDAILRSGKGSQIDVHARPVRAPNKQLDGKQHAVNLDPEDGTSFRYVEISVADNGPGMDDETLSRCTDPFFTTKDTNSGTGLGLAMVYGFIQQSDGDLRIYSEVGIGTTVQMTLPRGSELGNREEAVIEEEVLRGNGETLLVVEDELQLAMMITDVLEDLGFEVITARSGHDALALAEEGEEFDLLLTDVVMPGKIGGFELARRLRQIRPNLPVIYTSGYTGFTASEMGDVQAPILQKPAPAAELAETILQELAKVE